MNEFDDHKNKILITGVCGDIGSYIAQSFLETNSFVIGIDIKKTPPLNIRNHKNFVFSSCDLTDPYKTEVNINSLFTKHGSANVLINNVGLIYNSPIIQFIDGKLTNHNYEDWSKVLSTSLNSAFYVTTNCINHMIKNRIRGVVINISSISAKGNIGQSAYSAAKGGMNSMTIAQAKELGPLGIRVGAISPGFIDTPSTHNAMKKETLNKIKSNIPLKRLGTLAELYHAIEFIIENQYFTGSVLELDGGLSI